MEIGLLRGVSDFTTALTDSMAATEQLISGLHKTTPETFMILHEDMVTKQAEFDEHFEALTVIQLTDTKQFLLAACQHYGGNMK